MTDRLKSAFIKITIHYAVLLSVSIVTLSLFPSFADYLPVGTTERLFSTTVNGELTQSTRTDRLEEISYLSQGLFFSLCFITSLLVTIPVGLTYIGTRSIKKVDPSIAKAIVLFPLAVTGLVLIIQNSLALAFGLAGMVAGAGIRFRTNLREFTDALFFLITIGIGLAAGIGALGLAIIMSSIFCYSILCTYLFKFGEAPPKEKSKAIIESPKEVETKEN